MPEFKQWSAAVEIPLDLIDPDPLNPNVMSDEDFEKLVAVIQKQGFDEPLQVVENPDKPGRYIIVGGEHRFKASKRLGFSAVPCCVKECYENDLERRTALVSRNMIKGQLDNTKLNTMIRDLTSRYSDVEGEELAKQMHVSRQKKEEVAQSVLDNQIDSLPSPKEEDLRPFNNTHILLSFPPARMSVVQGILDQLKDYDDVEILQSSN